MPRAHFSVVTGGKESRRAAALIDTGASYIMIPVALSKDMLGVNPDEVKKSGKELNVSPISNKDIFIYGWQRDIRLRGNQFDQEFIEIQNAWVYVAEHTLTAFPVLFGQFDGFQERFLKHHNRAANRFWELRHL
jgi:hypothetical protein